MRTGAWLGIGGKWHRLPSELYEIAAAVDALNAAGDDLAARAAPMQALGEALPSAERHRPPLIDARAIMQRQSNAAEGIAAAYYRPVPVSCTVTAARGVMLPPAAVFAGIADASPARRTRR